MAKATEQTIELKAIVPKTMTVTIEGNGSLMLNKMNDVTAKALTNQRKDKAKNTEKPNMWEEIITSLHWRDGKPSEFTEESFRESLTNNAPCIPTFAFKKSWGEGLTRNNIDTYSTKFDASVNIIAKNGLVPIRFAEHSIDERLMSPKKGSPVLSRRNVFDGWSADITIEYLDNVYSAEQIVNIINISGFGIGIGSGRRVNGFGRYSVVAVK